MLFVKIGRKFFEFIKKPVNGFATAVNRLRHLFNSFWILILCGLLHGCTEVIKLFFVYFNSVLGIKNLLFKRLQHLGALGNKRRTPTPYLFFIQFYSIFKFYQIFFYKFFSKLFNFIL